MATNGLGAVLKVVGKLETEKCTIKYENYMFVLYDDDDKLCAMSEHWRPVKKYAYANGAQSVRCDYDGTLEDWI